MCSRRFNRDSANVACRHLGFPGALRATRDFPFSLTAPVWLGDTRCTGQESSLEQCSHEGIGNYNARYCRLPATDIGVVCIGMYACGI